jgi:hypothetical protein
LNQRFGSQFFPFEIACKPNFKRTNIELLRNNVKSGDIVTIIGGGRGITSVVAARMAGPNGKLHIYEPDEKRIPIIRETLELNDIETDYEIYNIAIGPVYCHGREVRKGNEKSDVVSLPPTNLPKSDVLEMDCEGAELAILNNLSIRPRSIIVEAHFHKQFCPYSSIDTLQTAMTNLGYSISGHGYVGGGRGEWGDKKPPKVLLGEILYPEA